MGISDKQQATYLAEKPKFFPYYTFIL